MNQYELALQNALRDYPSYRLDRDDREALLLDIEWRSSTGIDVDAAAREIVREVCGAQSDNVVSLDYNPHLVPTTHDDNATIDISHLPSRYQEGIAYLVEGYDDHEIAQKLGVSLRQWYRTKEKIRQLMGGDI